MPPLEIKQTRGITVSPRDVTAGFLAKFIDGLDPNTQIRIKSHAARDQRDTSTVTLEADVPL